MAPADILSGPRRKRAGLKITGIHPPKIIERYYNRMSQRVKKKIAFLIFFTLLFFIFFITLLRGQPCTRTVRGWFLKASPLRVNDIQSSVVSLPIDGRRYNPPAGRIEISPAPIRREDAGNRCGEHNIQGDTSLELAGGQVCRDTPRPPGILQEGSIWLDELIEKIWLTESSGRLDPPDGDGGLAVGPLQLHKCVIDDVNRYWRTNFSYADRRDLHKSKQIARLYVTMWLDIHKQEIAARIYNGGPRGWQKKTTDEYWQRVQKQK